MQQVTPEFRMALAKSLELAAQEPDDAVNYMTRHVPVYGLYQPTSEQAVAGGCTTCTYLGLWARAWAGYPPAPHGIVWLFEEGIRKQGGDLTQQTKRVLIHEFGHAAQKDHVLDAMEAEKKQRAMARPFAAGYKPCGGCPGR